MKKLYLVLTIILVANSFFAQEKSSTSAHYLFPEFKQGVVLMKSGKKNEALLNYNLVTQEMIFDQKGVKLAIGKDEVVFVDTVFLEGREFVLLDFKLVELLHNSTWQLYAEHNCKIRELGQSAGFGGTSETSAIRTHSSISAGGFLYELELPNNYKVDPYTHYWFNKNEKLKKIVNMKSLKKLYKSKRDLFNTFVDEHDVQYDNPKSIVELIEYLESK